eukprot:scaffold340247_cov48-Attheya_sp.AAC.1
MAPALMEVPTQEEANKYMMWPLTFVVPGQEKKEGALADESPLLTEARANAGTGQWRTMEIVTIPESVVAVATLTDVSMGPVVRMADAQLRKVLARDGLELEPFSTPSLPRHPAFDLRNTMPFSAWDNDGPKYGSISPNTPGNYMTLQNQHNII